MDNLTFLIQKAVLGTEWDITDLLIKCISIYRVLVQVGFLCIMESCILTQDGIMWFEAVKIDSIKRLDYVKFCP